MPDPRLEECAVIEKDTAEGLARASHVTSSLDCVSLKHTEFHTELGRPAGTGRYWFSNRVERVGRKCSTQTREEERRAQCEKSSTYGQKDKKAEWKNVGTWSLKLYQCHPPLLFVPLMERETILLNFILLINIKSTLVVDQWLNISHHQTAIGRNRWNNNTASQSKVFSPCHCRAVVRALMSTRGGPPAYRLYNAVPALSSLHRENNSLYCSFIFYYCYSQATSNLFINMAA